MCLFGQLVVLIEMARITSIEKKRLTIDVIAGDTTHTFSSFFFNK